MPKKGFRHSAESRAKMSVARQGYKHSEETKKKIGDANRKRIGPLNPRWTETPKVFGIHKRVWKKKPRIGICEHCGKKGATDFANINNHNYTDDPADYIELCRPCHRKYDR